MMRLSGFASLCVLASVVTFAAPAAQAQVSGDPILWDTGVNADQSKFMDMFSNAYKALKKEGIDVELGRGNLTPAKLKDYRVLILTTTHPWSDDSGESARVRGVPSGRDSYTEEQGRAVRAFVDGGGCLLILNECPYFSGSYPELRPILEALNLVWQGVDTAPGGLETVVPKDDPLSVFDGIAPGTRIPYNDAGLFTQLPRDAKVILKGSPQSGGRDMALMYSTYDDRVIHGGDSDLISNWVAADVNYKLLVNLVRHLQTSCGGLPVIGD